MFAFVRTFGGAFQLDLLLQNLPFCRFHLLGGEIFILQGYGTVGDIFGTGGISTNLPLRSACILKKWGLKFLGNIFTH
jgi:hypothetical protein